MALEPFDLLDEQPFTYECPDCGGSGEVWVDVNPRDPASGTPVRCWLCNGDGTTTLAGIEDYDQATAFKAPDNWIPPIRELRPIRIDQPTTETPVPAIDPWATPKDIA